MPLVVPALRLLYVFLNIYETFKVLKLPPPSARNGGQPSTRAMGQRKRAMKGCMTIWLVWGCFAMYESTVDTVVSLFIPFYDELKSLVILFFMLTRARGAEPIYLHVFRPVIKPYAATMDSCLELAFSLGDFLLLVSSLPIQVIMGYFKQWSSSAKDPISKDDHTQRDFTPRLGSVKGHVTRLAARAEMHHSADILSCTRAGSTTSPAVEIQGNCASDGDRASRRDLEKARPRSEVSRLPRIAAQTSAGLDQPVESAPPPYEIWYPPSSSYDIPVTNPLSGLPTPPNDKPPPFLSSTPAGSEMEPEDEWRQYPPFPSAYPPTPLPVSAKLPTANGSSMMPMPTRQTNDTLFSDIAEEPINIDTPPGLSTGAEPSNALLENQDFRGSLQPLREFANPDSADDSSDDQSSMHGIQSDGPIDAAMSTEDVTDDDGEDEDDFDVTLRTPFPKVRQHEAAKEKASLTSASMESLTSRSTALSTTDNGSSLRTRTNSEASTTHSVSDASSVAGRKRRLPNTVIKARIRLTEQRSSSKLSGALLRSRTATPVRRRGGLRKPPSAMTTSAEDIAGTDSDILDEEDSSDVKRRRVVGVPGGRLPRPSSRREDSDRTIRGVASTGRNGQAATAKSRAPSRRPLPGEMTRVQEDVPPRRPASVSERRTRSNSRR
ncbi:hypothetical protein AcV5_001123 [Taiwanofungus camphoratus]|nr:hypothetical protein AcV5_001123 [Antrodia cinnamomea]